MSVLLTHLLLLLLMHMCDGCRRRPVVRRPFSVPSHISKTEQERPIVKYGALHYYEVGIAVSVVSK